MVFISRMSLARIGVVTLAPNKELDENGFIEEMMSGQEVVKEPLCMKESVRPDQ